jgi:hypothetical protein
MVNMVFSKRDYDDEQIGALGHGMQITVSLKQGEAQARANARLIAAAPEMLKALNVIIETLRGDEAKTTPFFSIGYSIAEAENAIAKATGEK